MELLPDDDIGVSLPLSPLPPFTSPLHRARPASAALLPSSRASKRRIADALRTAAADPALPPPPPRLDLVSLLPEPLALHVLSKVPPHSLAGSCALVCTSWAQLCRRDDLWKELCEPWALTEAEAGAVLGRWRGLFALAFGTNLVQSPSFSSAPAPPLPPLSPCSPAPGLLEPQAVEHMDSIPNADCSESEYRSLTHWVDHRVPDAAPGRAPTLWAGPSCFRTTVMAGLTPIPSPGIQLPGPSPAPVQRDLLSASASHNTPPGESAHCSTFPVGCSSPCGGIPPGRNPEARPHNPASSGAADDRAVPAPGTPALEMGAASPGAVQQYISLRGFPVAFLDTCPPLHITASCCFKGTEGVRVSEGEVGGGGAHLKLEVAMVAGEGQEPFFFWSSEASPADVLGWRVTEGSILSYPKGLRSIAVKVVGQDVVCTNVKLKFVANPKLSPT